MVNFKLLLQLPVGAEVNHRNLRIISLQPTFHLGTLNMQQGVLIICTHCVNAFKKALIDHRIEEG